METRTNLEDCVGDTHHVPAGLECGVPSATERNGSSAAGRDRSASCIRRPRPALDTWFEQVEAVLDIEGPATVEKFEHLCTIGRK